MFRNHWQEIHKIIVKDPIIIGGQFSSKSIVVYFTYKKIEKMYGIAIRSPWSGTLYILVIYGFLSHFIGAIYYQMYVDELLSCRRSRWEYDSDSNGHVLEQLPAGCPQNDTYHEGLLSDAYVNKLSSRTFTQKFMFCFSWGLKTVSSMGQNLKSNVFVIIVNIYAIIMGLLLFADLIARMQSIGEQEEQQMVRQTELEDWANFHQLPPHLKKRVQQTVQSQFHENRGMNDDALLDSLPMHLRSELRRHLFLELVSELPIFEGMDAPMLHGICGHLRTFTGAEGMIIVLERDCVHQMLFIISGELEIFSIADGSSSSTTIGAGGMCGEELLTWSFLPTTSTDNLPLSTCSVKCLSSVDAFSLLAKDLRLLAVQFNYDQKFVDAFTINSGVP